MQQIIFVFFSFHTLAHLINRNSAKTLPLQNFRPELGFRPKFKKKKNRVNRFKMEGRELNT